MFYDECKYNHINDIKIHFQHEIIKPKGKGNIKWATMHMLIELECHMDYAVSVRYAKPMENTSTRIIIKAKKSTQITIHTNGL